VYEEIPQTIYSPTHNCLMPPRTLKEYGAGRRWKDVTAVEGRPKFKLVDEKPRKVETAKEDVRSSVPKSTLIDPPASDDYPMMEDFNPNPIDVELITPQVRKVQNRFVGTIFQDLREYIHCDRDNRIT
jgi:hypothetical protein